MKQILQSLKTGVTEVAEVLCPSAGRGQLLIRTTEYKIAGCERCNEDLSSSGSWSAPMNRISSNGPS